MKSASTHLHSVTPLLRSEPLSRRLGSDVWIKMDCLQPVVQRLPRQFRGSDQPAITLPAADDRKNVGMADALGKLH